MIVMVWKAVIEILLAIAGKIAFRAIGERFATRLVVYGLEWLRDKFTNDVTQSTLDDVINSLKGKGLKVIDDK